MKDFSKTHLTFLVLFLVVGLAGGYFWYWSVGNLDEKVQARDELQTRLVQVEKKGLPPTSAVLSKLQESQKGFEQLSEKSLEEVKQNIGLFDSVVLKQEAGKAPQGVPSDTWKKLMNDRRIALDKLAVKNKVAAPKDFFYGFSKFRLASPAEAATGQLGIELLGLTEISSILIDSKVNELFNVKRVYVEDGSQRGGGAPAPGGVGAEESLSASVLSGPQNLYQIYPFEVAIKCTTPELREVINRLNQSKYFFVIRFLTVENEKSNVGSKSSIQAEKGAEAKSKNLLVVTVAGNEMLNVRIRIDMLVWSKQALEQNASGSKGAAK